jgi:hypothetical protein
VLLAAEHLDEPHVGNQSRPCRSTDPRNRTAAGSGSRTAAGPRNRPAAGPRNRTTGSAHDEIFRPDADDDLAIGVPGQAGRDRDG